MDFTYIYLKMTKPTYVLAHLVSLKKTFPVIQPEIKKKTKTLKLPHACIGKLLIIYKYLNSYDPDLYIHIC